MNYKVLYRKYRPDDFNNLVGQDVIVKILKNSIIENKLAHAYIFSGPRGTGKTSTAKIFSKNINCLNPVEGNACGKCINCTCIDTSSDIIEIDAASNNGVNEIREIINNVKLVPSNLKYKVYIIDEVHMLSPSAFNALLLTLEEPPNHVKFILATTNIESVPITILSRCQRFDFKKITVENIINRLKEICSLEDIKITDEALEQIAKISDGGLRDSLSLLDQISKENTKIDENIVMNYSGNVSNKIIENIFDLLDQNEAVKLEKTIYELLNKSIDYKLFIKSFIKHLSGIVSEKVINNKSTRLSVSQIKSLATELTLFQNKINVNVDVYSMLIIILYSYLDFKETHVINENTFVNNKDDVILERLPEEINSGKISNEQFSDLVNIRINNCFAEANKDEKNRNILLWDGFIKDVDVSIKGLLLDTKVAMSSKEIITLYVERENDFDEINLKYSYIINQFNDFAKNEKQLVFVTKEKWLKLVNKYKKDKDSGIIYTVKDESNYMNETSVADIFDENKIEEI